MDNPAEPYPSTAADRQSDRAYEQLRQIIIRAELRPGALVEEPVMMHKLGVGRTPLREALQRLAQEDLIRNVPRRGYFVTETSAADIFAVFEVRAKLEGLASALAADRMSADQLDRFDALLAEARAGIARDNRDLTWNLGIDERFHRLIWQASGNDYLASAISRLYGLSVRTLYLSLVPVTLAADEIDNYERIYQAMQRRDRAAAEAGMLTHLNFAPHPQWSPHGVRSNPQAPINRSKAVEQSI